jgi:hypothetical protein
MLLESLIRHEPSRPRLPSEEGKLGRLFGSDHARSSTRVRAEHSLSRQLAPLINNRGLSGIAAVLWPDTLHSSERWHGTCISWRVRREC